MYIRALTIHGHRKFKFSGIKTLTWNDISDVNILLGRNGSGKSTLLELSLPDTLPRPTFNTGGYITLELDHEGSRYQLMTDYSQHNSPHVFIKDNTKLNISGTTNIQQELLQDHLGLTPMVYKLLTGKLRLSKMTAAIRKTTLMELDPSNMTLALDMHKKITRKIKAYNNNLDMLYRQKQEHLDQMLSEDELQLINKQHEHLNDQREVLVSWMYTIEPHIKQLQEKRKKLNTKNISLSQLNFDIKMVDNSIYNYRDIDRETYQIRKVEIGEQIAVLTSKINSGQDELQQVIRKIDQYTELIDTQDSAGIQREIQDKLKELDKCIELYADVDMDNYQPIHQSSLPAAKESLQKIWNILKNISTIDAPIVSRDELMKQIHNTTQLQSSISLLTKHIDQKKLDLDELHKTSPSNETIPSTCPKTGCTLFNGYQNARKIYDDRVTQYTEDIKSGEKKLVRLKKDYELVSKRAQDSQTVFDGISKVHHILTRELRGCDQLIHQYDPDRFNNQPFRIHQLLDQHIQISKQYWFKVKAIKERDELRRKLTNTKSKDQMPIEFVTKLLDEQKEKYSELKRAFEKQAKQRTNLQRELDSIENFEKDVSRISKVKELLDTCYMAALADTGIQHYTKLLSVIRNVIADITDEMKTIKVTIDEQMKLLDRVNNNINIMINEAESNKEKYGRMEMALSPKTGFPSTHMARFINGIISDTTEFIDKVFTYRMRILPVTEGEKLTYTFPIAVGDVTVSDISQCSDGQKSMIDLAFNIAIINRLGLNEYPLFLDEIDKDLDKTHKRQLPRLFSLLIDHEIIQQLFIVGHDATVEGLPGKQIHMDSSVENTAISIDRY